MHMPSKVGLLVDTMLSNVLIDTYAKCESLDDIPKTRYYKKRLWYRLVSHLWYQPVRRYHLNDTKNEGFLSADLTQPIPIIIQPCIDSSNYWYTNKPYTDSKNI
jgi:hypothetical protein